MQIPCHAACAFASWLACPCLASLPPLMISPMHGLFLIGSTACFFIHVVSVLQHPHFRETLVTDMPLGSKKLRAAKHTCQDAPKGFATPALHTAIPEVLEYLALDNGSDGPIIDVESGTESGIQGTSVMTALAVSPSSAVSSPFLSIQLSDSSHTKMSSMLLNSVRASSSSCCSDAPMNGSGSTWSAWV